MTLQLETRTGVKRHLVTLDEYERMCEAGVFEPEARIELLRGEIVDMPPPGPEHESSVIRLHLLFYEQVQRQAIVSPQGNSIRLPNSNSRPQPDITILRWRDGYYKGRPITEQDVILLVEISVSSLEYDRGAKLELYAEAGIPEYWVVNIVEDVVEVYSGPSEGKYQSARKIKRGETLQLPGEISGSVNVSDLLG